MFHGHWQSGTRKLSRHYQSGDGGDGVLFTGMKYALLGLQYSSPVDTYDDPTQAFYDDSSSNIIVAPNYKLFSTFPTRTKVETGVHVLYGFTMMGKLQHTGTTSDIINVWRYGFVTSVPSWIYEDIGGGQAAMRWGKPTVTDVDKNQNGIVGGPFTWDFSVYYDNPTATQRSFTDVYGDKRVNILAPVYEIIAVPAPSSAYEYDKYTFVLTDAPPGSVFPNKIRVNGITKQGVKRVSTTGQPGPSGLCMLTIHLTDNNYYIRCCAVQGGIGLQTEEVGFIGVTGSADSFAGDKLFVLMVDDQGNFMSAGSGMVFALRLDHMEVLRNVKITNYLISTVYSW